MKMSSFKSCCLSDSDFGCLSFCLLKVYVAFPDLRCLITPVCLSVYLSVRTTPATCLYIAFKVSLLMNRIRFGTSPSYNVILGYAMFCFQF